MWSEQEQGMGADIPLPPFKPLFKQRLSPGGGTVTPIGRSLEGGTVPDTQRSLSHVRETLLSMR